MNGHRQQGTNAGYQWHVNNRRMPACESCRAAHAANKAMRRDLRRLIGLLAELFEPETP